MNQPAPDVRALHTDVAVIGSGLGAVAAALAAARAGRGVVLAARPHRLGGQATTQLVPALDEHPHVETGGVSASYRAFRDLIRARYDGLANPGGGWVSRLCFEPAAAEHAIEALLAPHVASGRLTILTGVAPRAVRREGRRLTSVRLHAGGAAAPVVELFAEVFCDATEAGDLLPLAGAPWVVGSEGRDAHGESLALPGGPRPDAVQSCTVGFVVEHAPEGAPCAPVGSAPEGYEGWRDGQPFTLEIAGWDDRVHRYRMFEQGPDGHPPFWTYRRLRDGAVLGGPDAALINWAGNDYADRSSVDHPEEAYTEAKRLSAAFLHWLRTECPRDDGGHGYPGLTLAPHIAGTPDGYAEEPYLRESRRLRTATPVRQQDLEPIPGRARAANRPDSGGLAMYHMDLHSRIGHPAGAYAPTAPFQVPLSSLVAAEPDNLLAAAKNLAATQVAASAYRVHHGEWAVGEAAGALAARSCARALPPARIVGERRELTLLQGQLAAHGVPLAWTLDVPPGDPRFAAVQLLAAAGALTGRRAAELDVRPEDPADAADRHALHTAAARLLGDPTTIVLPDAAPADTATRWGDLAVTLADRVQRALGRPARTTHGAHA
ncbi:FAD-dependent oxidoreductase [Streptomyces sp. NPDC127049]|uniref:FAD-dependent oxidoreductase n=1 Tax=Streptomyces sp. NPDC127049 TaxID=3347118 RepID=UPI00364DF36E